MIATFAWGKTRQSSLKIIICMGQDKDTEWILTYQM